MCLCVLWPYAGGLKLDLRVHLPATWWQNRITTTTTTTNSDFMAFFINFGHILLVPRSWGVGIRNCWWPIKLSGKMSVHACPGSWPHSVIQHCWPVCLTSKLQKQFWGANFFNAQNQLRQGNYPVKQDAALHCSFLMQHFSVKKGRAGIKKQLTLHLFAKF
jgi:hypothetical protein